MKLSIIGNKLIRLAQDDVAKACEELGIRDWSKEKSLQVTEEEARRIQTALDKEALNISVAEFRHGLQIELEHGKRFSDANVTNNHPIKTGKIVLAHLKESLLYYRRLEVAELEAKLLQALQSNPEAKKIATELATARSELADAEHRAFTDKDLRKTK